MELQTLKTLEVSTFDEENGRIKVSVSVTDGSFDAAKVFEAVAAATGLKASSQPYFRLFEGLLSPLRCFGRSSNIPEDVTSLSLQKWCFDSREELRFTSQDETAQRLVCHQAKTWVQQGWIKMSEADSSKLEDYLDPAFTVHGQYIKLCKTLTGYHSYHIERCSIEYRTAGRTTPFGCQKDPCSVVLDLESMEMSSGGELCVYKWPSIKSWQLREDDQQVILAVGRPCMQRSEVTEWSDGSPTSPLEMVITSPQCRFVVDVIIALITQLQKSMPESPRFHVSMIKTLDDGSTRWENALYKDDTYNRDRSLVDKK